MEILIMLGQFFLGLFIMVGLHELGHLLFAKLFGMRVDSYTIGFPPTLLSFKWKGTSYKIGLLPLGGAVKIRGMVDESLDTATLNEPPKPWEYRAKPPWQRLIVILGGVLFNIISGLVIYILLTFYGGHGYCHKDVVNQHGIVPHEIGRSIGLQTGDKIIKLNGKDFQNFNDIMSPIKLLEEHSAYTVLRNGKKITLPIPPDFLTKLTDTQNKEKGLIASPLLPPIIASLQPNGEAAQGGLQPRDLITSIEGTPIASINELITILPTYTNKKVTITYSREGITGEKTIAVNNKGHIGIILQALPVEIIKYSLVEAIPVGIKKAWGVISTNVLAIRKIITGKLSASQSLSGPIGIAKMFGGEVNWIKFWGIVGTLSMLIAFTNLLPIPALDGGHAILILYEMIIGRTLPLKLVEKLQQVGIAVLLLLTAYIMYNDICKLI